MNSKNINALYFITKSEGVLNSLLGLALRANKTHSYKLTTTKTVITIKPFNSFICGFDYNNLTAESIKCE